VLYRVPLENLVMRLIVEVVVVFFIFADHFPQFFYIHCKSSPVFVFFTPPASSDQGEQGVASLSTAQRPALLEQLRPRRTVDAAIHAASAQQRFLRRVDDGVHAHFRDVIANNDKGHDTHLCAIII
jgi:hypothetical protein